MNTLNSIKCAAVLLPALALGVPMANANDPLRDDPCREGTAVAAAGLERDHHRDEHSSQPGRDTDQRDGPAAATSRQSEDRSDQRSEYMANKPARGFHSDSLVGQEVKNRSSDESVGTVSNLLLDEEGQIVAVIIGVGGLMGLGERDVAIAWNQIERTVDGDETTLWVNLNEQSVENAPEYSSDRKYSADRSTRSRQ